MPVVVVIAGPNGAGKSTSAPGLLRDALGITTFVNADEIARGLAGFDPEAVAFEAGRIMLERIHELATAGADFAFETTLASRHFAGRIEGWKASGFVFHLVYLWLPSADMAINRVKDRVRRGGHHVPDSHVRNRYKSGLRNFFSLYRPLADTWSLFDSSQPVGPRLIAFGTPDSQEVFDHAIWELIQRQVTHG
jgi:predicted ABC-type ATPase